jgi:two-component system, NtrC family, sensor histidine kinase HydH
MAWIGVAVGILLISALQLAIPLSDLHWHNVFQHLYYLPIVVAALSSGWLGGLAAAVLAGVSNLPHNILSLKVLPNYAIDQILDIPIFCAAGVLTGVLAERGRKQRADLERTTKRLTEVYQELQRNFEQMKRSERLFALGQLSAGLAHEIRNPLASIAGAAGILQRNSDLDRKNLECLEIISRECQRLNRLLSNFLEFARPRTPHFQQIAIVPVLDSVLELAHHAPGTQRIELRMNVAPQLPSVESDPELLKQVLLNLVMNAIQAMPDGGDVVVSAAPQHERMLIQVKDGGAGIKPENLDRIFDPFFTTKDNGSGLGLSVAHQIVEQHGGMLTAAANLDRGTTFTVSLPLRHARHHEA